MSKIGRPKAENPKKYMHTIRFDAEMEARVQEYCQKRGISRGKAIREGIELLLAEKNEEPGPTT